MSAAAVAADPAVVSAKPQGERKPREPQAPPKPVKPKSLALNVRPVKAKNSEELTFPDVDSQTHIIVHTTLGSEYVAVPRTSAKNIPGLTVPDAPPMPPTPEPAAEGEEKKEEPEVVLPQPPMTEFGGMFASALIALNEWIDKKGKEGVSTAKFTNPLTHTDIAQLTSDEWEKDFSKNLFHDGQAIIGCLNFAEKNGLKGLQEFSIVALSCALRGKSATEMAHAMGQDNAFTAEEIAAGKAAYPEVHAVTKNRN